MRWSIRPQFIDVIRLRRAAFRYSAHGWDVTPGARLSGDRFCCERPGCPTVGCHPALEHWEEAATSDVAQIGDWWRTLPHTVLLATGRAFDVLEVPAHLGLRVLGLARLHGHVLGAGRLRVGGPLAVTPGGRWMFLVKPGDRLRPDLDGQPDVLHHGRGSWVPAPPTRLPDGRVRWAVTPDEVHWQLPDPYAVQALLVDAMAAALPGSRSWTGAPSNATDTTKRPGPPGAPSPGAPSAGAPSPGAPSPGAPSSLERSPVEPTPRERSPWERPVQRPPTERSPSERSPSERPPAERSPMEAGSAGSMPDSRTDPVTDVAGPRPPIVPRQASTERRAA